MEIASATLLGQTPTIEVRPAPKSTADASTAANDGTNARPDFWHRTFGKDGFTFSTVLDIVNPLQHIPIVSTIYQKLTGDVASPGANIIGGALFGGPIGLAVASADTALKSGTGKDMGGHMFAMFDSTTPATPTETMLADIDPVISPSAIPTADSASPQILADTPRLTAPTGTSQAKAPIKDVQLAAASAKTNTPFAFAMNNRRTPANGVGGSFVPLESRASVTPAAWTTPAATLASDPIAGAPKPAAKAPDIKTNAKVAVAVPDLKSLAANPDLINQLKLNGIRPHAANPTANHPPTKPTVAASRAAALPAALDTAASGGSDAAGSDPGSADGYASLMARNLARYMALQNGRSSPAKVNQAF